MEGELALFFFLEKEKSKNRNKGTAGKNHRYEAIAIVVDCSQDVLVGTSESRCIRSRIAITVCPSRITSAGGSNGRVRRILE